MSENQPTFGCLDGGTTVAQLNHFPMPERTLYLRGMAPELQEALDSRVVIEQAKGIIAERCETDVSRAFQHLRQLARETRRPISDVARGVIQGEVQVPLISLARCAG